MKYSSVRVFVDTVIESIERNDPDFTLLDITDPSQEIRLEHENSRFCRSVSGTFDTSTIVKLLKAAKESKYIDKIFLGYVEIGHSVSMALLELFEDGRTWKQLSLQGCPDFVAETCIALLATRGNVERLGLFNNLLDYSGFSSLGLILACNPPKLSALEVSDPISVGSAEALAAGLERNSNLTCLDLQNCTFLDGAMDELALGIGKNRSLRRLDLSACQLSDREITSLFLELDRHPSISELNLNGNYCWSGSISALSCLLWRDGTPGLSTVSLECQYGIDHKDGFKIGVLSKALLWNTSLKRLSLSHNVIVPDEISRFMLGAKESCLETLELCNCDLSDASVKTILMNLPHTMKELDLSENCFRDATTTLLLTETAKKHSNIEALELDRSLDGWHEINYLVRMNAAGKRICSSDKVVPRALWTLILHRIVKKDWQSYDEDGTGFCEDAIFYMISAAMATIG